MTPLLLSGPAVEPLSLVEAKSWLKLDSSDEDQLVQSLIASARLAVEAATNRLLITQQWRLMMDACRRRREAKAGGAFSLGGGDGFRPWLSAAFS